MSAGTIPHLLIEPTNDGKTGFCIKINFLQHNGVPSDTMFATKIFCMTSMIMTNDDLTQFVFKILKEYMEIKGDQH